MSLLEIKTVVSVDELRKDIRLIADNGEDWFSGLLASDDELNKWLSKKQLSFAKTDTAYFLFRERSGCKRCYITSSDISKLEQNIKDMLSSTDDVIITSVLDKNEQNKAVKDAIQAAGFNKYAINNHIVRMNDEKNTGNCRFPFAESTDFSSIKEIICENFSPYLDHIPDDDEIVDAIENNQVIVVRDKKSNKVVAIQTFKKKGKILDGRYLASAKSYRMTIPLGPLLWKETMKCHYDVIKFTGWVKEGNITAERLNGLLKFKKDGLTETYYINKVGSEYEDSEKT